MLPRTSIGVVTLSLQTPGAVSTIRNARSILARTTLGSAGASSCSQSTRAMKCSMDETGVYL